MSLMTRFQDKKQKDPSYGAEDSFEVLGTMPTTAIARQQAASGFAKELENDLTALKLIQSIKEKIRVKAETLVPKYMPAVEGLMSSGAADPLLGQILVWLFDIKDIPGAMNLATYCIGHKVSMPERFKRDLPTFLCDTIVEWAEAEHEAGRSTEPYFGQVCDLANSDDAPWDIPDQVRARIFRLKGLIAMKKEDWKQAVIDFEFAAEYGAKIKTWLARANKKYQAMSNAADPE